MPPGWPSVAVASATVTVDHSVEGSGCHRRTCTGLYVPDPAFSMMRVAVLCISWTDVFREVFLRFSSPSQVMVFYFISWVVVGASSAVLAGHYGILVVVVVVVVVVVKR